MGWSMMRKHTIVDEDIDSAKAMSLERLGLPLPLLEKLQSSGLITVGDLVQIFLEYPHIVSHLHSMIDDAKAVAEAKTRPLDSLWISPELLKKLQDANLETVGDLVKMYEENPTIFGKLVDSFEDLAEIADALPSPVHLPGLQSSC